MVFVKMTLRVRSEPKKSQTPDPTSLHSIWLDSIDWMVWLLSYKIEFEKGRAFLFL